MCGHVAKAAPDFCVDQYSWPLEFITEEYSFSKYFDFFWNFYLL